MGLIKFFMEVCVVIVAILVAAYISFEVTGSANLGVVAVVGSMIAWANYSDRKTKRAQRAAESEVKK